MKSIMISIALCSVLSSLSHADSWAAMPSFIKWQITSPYGAGLDIRRANDKFSYGFSTNYKEKRISFSANKYSADSFLTNGIGTFASISSSTKANQFGGYFFNEGSSYFFMGMVRHRIRLGSGYDVSFKRLFPKFELTLTPRFFDIGMDLSYRYDTVNGQNQNMFELGLVYLW